MNAVIIYDEPSCAVTARTTLEAAAQRAESVRWEVRPWCREILMLSPAMAAQAKTEAAEAHLIVLALRQPGVLTQCLLDWLDEWAACRKVQNAALAVWDARNGNRLAEVAPPDLSAFAARHGLSFVLDGVTSPGAESGRVAPNPPKSGRGAHKASGLLGHALRLENDPDSRRQEMMAC
jgi:hypothetical protein